MNIVKRILACVLTAVMVMSFAACDDAPSGDGGSKEGSGSSKMHTAYKNVIQDIINRYGIRDGKNLESVSVDEESGFAYQRGLWEAKAIDLTGDGDDELFVVYITDDDIAMKVYEYKKSEAQLKWSGSAGWTGVYSMSVLQGDNCVYWQFSNMRSFTNEIAAYIDGEYKSSNDIGEISEEDYNYINNGTDGLVGENSRRFDVLCKMLGIKDTQSNEAFLRLSNPHSNFAEVDRLVTEWGVKIPERRETPLELLGKISYHGDKSKCVMTKEMAKAYIDAIESQKQYPANAGQRVRALLMDVAGDGMPLLMTVVSNENLVAGIKNPDGSYRSSFSIWTWDGEKAQIYDFEKDTETGLVFDFGFHPQRPKGEITVGDGVSMDVGGASGTMTYDVENAMLKKVKHTLDCSAYRESEDSNIMLGRLMPGIKSAVKGEIWGYEAPIEDLIAAGWECETDEDIDTTHSVYAHFEDGKLIRDYNYPSDYDMNEIHYEVYWVSTGSEEIYRDKWTEAQPTIDALEKYIEVAGKPVYSYSDVALTLPDDQLAQIRKLVAEKFKGTIGQIYKIGDDLYYVVIYIGEDVEGGMLIKNTKGGSQWRQISYSNEVMTDQGLAAAVSSDGDVPNIVIDTSKTKDGEKYLREVLEAMDGTVPNRTAKDQLAAYVENYVSTATEKTVKAKDNVVTVTDKTLKGIAADAGKVKDELIQVLEDENAMPNKLINTRIRFICKKVKLGEGVQIAIDQSCLEELGDADGLVFMVGDEGHSVTIDRIALKLAVDKYTKFVVIIKLTDKNVYEVQFADANGNTIERLDNGVTVSVPAANELCTIWAEYRGNTDNWGGSFDSSKKTISFNTGYSGRYTVLEEDTEIKDISQLSEAEQKAIEFMVSKGFFTLDDGSFDPDGNLTRYAFSEALVRIFFSIDPSATASFTDVAKNHPYYKYVASGQAKNIIDGYEDNTFRGDNAVLREEAMALSSRALRERKGYIEPQSPWDYLHFADNKDISDWAEKSMALAVREGLIDDGGMLNPQSAISRKDSAILLYRLFLLLNQVEPVAADTGSAGGFPVGAVAATVGAVALLGAGAVGAVIWFKKRKI